MYNLFVHLDAGAWDGEPVRLERNRCVKGHTSEDMRARFGGLSPSQISRLRRLPSVFAYERSCRKDPRFGFVRDVSVGRDKVTIKYNLLDVDPFLTVEQLEQRRGELRLGEWELDRTHWAVKEVDLARRLRPLGIRVPLWRPIDIETHRFSVAVSFPGDRRSYVEAVVRELQKWIGSRRLLLQPGLPGALGEAQPGPASS